MKILDAGEPRQSGQGSKIGVALKEGISQEQAKKIGKLIRDDGPKGVKVQVQGDELRVTSKSRDDLQSVIALVKEHKGSVQAPKTVDFVDAIPLSALGKPDKKALRARYWGDSGRQVN